MKTLELKTHVGCRREIPCERCPNLVDCITEWLRDSDIYNSRNKPKVYEIIPKGNKLKVVIRY